ETSLAHARVQGEAIVYRLYDLGYEIDLDRAFALLASSAPERPRPLRGEAQAIQIPNPPVTVGLGEDSLSVEGRSWSVDLSPRLFDSGVVSGRGGAEAPPDIPGDEYPRFGSAAATARGGRALFARTRGRLMDRVAAATRKPGEAPVTEDYVVFRVNRLAG